MDPILEELSDNPSFIELRNMTTRCVEQENLTCLTYIMDHLIEPIDWKDIMEHSCEHITPDIFEYIYNKRKDYIEHELTEETYSDFFEAPSNNTEKVLGKCFMNSLAYNNTNLLRKIISLNVTPIVDDDDIKMAVELCVMSNYEEALGILIEHFFDATVEIEYMNNILNSISSWMYTENNMDCKQLIDNRLSKT